MTKDEALHKALKVLNCLNNDRVYETAWVKGAINACEEALEQPKNTQPLDEVIEEFMKDPAMKQAMDKAREKLSPLFSHPTPQTTQEHSMTYEDGFTHGYDAYLADYKEQPTQEPVAWMHRVDEDITEFNDFQACPKCEPLYTHPKEWQGLSDEEILDIKVKAELGNWYDFSHAIEAKLKEKNDAN